MRNKILILVENQTYLDLLIHLFKFFELSVRVFTTSQKQFGSGEKNRDLIILDVHKGSGRLPKLIEKIRMNFPNVQMICLVNSKRSKVRKVMRPYHVEIFLTEQDSLYRVYKIVKSLGRRASGGASTA